MFATRILVIEDNEDNLALMRLLLERAKYEVITASTGAAGLELASQESPDIILLDLAMPEMDGWEVAQALKANILTQDIPIIAITAHVLPKARERALKAGCSAFIPKPFNIPQLIGEIEQLLDW
jgi:CheY-like chemotaxis protein